MATRADTRNAKLIEAEEIERLAGAAEFLVDIEDSKKDLKEKRKLIKVASYVGPYKIKHTIPKGKHL